MYQGHYRGTIEPITRYENQPTELKVTTLCGDPDIVLCSSSASSAKKTDQDADGDDGHTTTIEASHTIVFDYCAVPGARK
eukprot:scaffold33389_cov54-Attheya_sp.AAC.4